MRRRIALITLVGLLTAFGFIVLGADSTLPDRVATHFGANGLPNGWMSRDVFARSMATVVLVPVAMVQGIGFFLGRLPSSVINLPNRDYWLAPERRTKTLERVQTAMLEFGNATLAFMLFVVWSIIDANKTGEPRLGSSFAYGLFAFLAFVAVRMFFLVKPYFRVPKEA
jgi:serine/threonine-protein kinase